VYVNPSLKSLKHLEPSAVQEALHVDKQVVVVLVEVDVVVVEVVDVVVDVVDVVVEEVVDVVVVVVVVVVVGRVGRVGSVGRDRHPRQGLVSITNRVDRCSNRYILKPKGG